VHLIRLGRSPSSRALHHRHFAEPAANDFVLLGRNGAQVDKHPIVLHAAEHGRVAKSQLFGDTIRSFAIQRDCPTSDRLFGQRAAA
jgi:hypothetical protein